MSNPVIGPDVRKAKLRSTFWDMCDDPDLADDLMDALKKEVARAIKDGDTRLDFLRG